MAQGRVGTASEWDALPVPEKPKRTHALDDDIDQLEQGSVVFLPYENAKQRRGLRLAVARLAATRGFKTDARYTDTEIAFKKSAEPYISPEPKPRKPRTRKAQPQDEEQEETTSLSSL